MTQDGKFKRADMTVQNSKTMMDKRNASVSVEKFGDEINFSRRSLYPDIWAGILTEAPRRIQSGFGRPLGSPTAPSIN